MTWWAWLLQLIAWGLLALSMWLTFTHAKRDKTLKPWALLLAMAGAVVSALLFVFLSPSAPHAAVTVSLALLGAFAGTAVSFAARLAPQGKTVFSSQGQWYSLAWCSLLFLASVLVVAGQAASKVAVSLAVFASLSTAGYVLTIYLRHASMKYKGA